MILHDSATRKYLMNGKYENANLPTRETFPASLNPGDLLTRRSIFPNPGASVPLYATPRVVSDGHNPDKHSRWSFSLPHSQDLGVRRAMPCYAHQPRQTVEWIRSCRVDAFLCLLSVDPWGHRVLSRDQTRARSYRLRTAGWCCWCFAVSVTRRAWECGVCIW